MPRNRKPPTAKTIEALRHEQATRKNIPTAEYQSVLQKEAQEPVRAAYERRNRDLDPQLVGRGKDEADWSDLVVQAAPLYIQEKVHPKVLIDDLLRRTRESRREDAKEKKAAMDTYWVPGGNNLGTLGRWAFAELTEIYQIESDFKAKVESAFDEMLGRAGGSRAQVTSVIT